jgi:hypothetical protein
MGLALGAGCSADSASPTLSQSDPTVRAVGDLTFSSCGSGGCSFEGAVVNDGPGCVSNVRGVTHLLDASGKEIESQPWTIDGRVRPGQQAPFTGCCFSAAAKDAQTTHRTEVTFTPIQCI